MNEMIYKKEIEKWDLFEISLPGKTEGNPFTDYYIQGTFINGNETKTVDGFYDGEGIYKVRFMPSFEGVYRFEIKGTFSSEKMKGDFIASKPSKNNHGPMRVCNTYHFAYEDGTPYYSIGTTCYVWNLQKEELRKQTLQTLADSAFNKIRFCIFPKHYDYNLNEPVTYPYEGTPCDSSVLTKENFLSYMGNAPGNDWDFTRFNPKHFQLLEECIKELMNLSIEADIIVMHPYDRWGFSEMDQESDNLYWNYVIARLSAFRNVWWSLANEYDLFPKKEIKDWERYASIISEKDVYHHLRSIHNCRPFYDHSRPWITHCSIQRQDVYKTGELTAEWRNRYKKPVVIDEIAYEGNIQHGWGNISAQEMVRRFWETVCRGGYAGHGETYMHEKEILWWSHGGELHGDSPARFHFLLNIMKQTPGVGLRPMEAAWDEVAATAETDITVTNGYYLYYYGFNRPSFRDYYYDDVNQYEVEVLDTWNMTIEKKGIFQGKIKVELPGREYMAVRIRKIENE